MGGGFGHPNQMQLALKGQPANFEHAYNLCAESLDDLESFIFHFRLELNWISSKKYILSQELNLFDSW